MKTALFTNFSDQEFTGYWDGKPKKFEAGESLYMPAYLAEHFAKHLTNRELLRKDTSGNLIHKDGDKMTSPKKPEDAPIFMRLFEKAYTPEEEEDLGSADDGIDALINSANKNRESNADLKKQAKQTAGPTEPQVVLPPDFDDDEDDSEASFEGKPVDDESKADKPETEQKS